MFPIKLNENRYLNPEAAADIEYTPTGVFSDHSFFTVLFLNSQLQPLHLKGDVAEEAFANWKTAHEDRRQQAAADRDYHAAKLNARSSRCKS